MLCTENLFFRKNKPCRVFNYLIPDRRKRAVSDSDTAQIIEKLKVMTLSMEQPGTYAWAATSTTRVATRVVGVILQEGDAPLL